MGTPAQDFGFVDEPIEDPNFGFVDEADLEQLPLEDVKPEVAFEPPQVALAPREPVVSSADAFGRGLRNPFGLADEISKGVTNVGDFVTGRRPIRRQIGQGMNQPLDPRQEGQIAADEETLLQEQAGKQHPVWHGAGRAATETALTALATAGMGGMAQAPTMTGRAAQAVKIGAPVGGLTGYGESKQKTLGGQALDTAQGAATGAILAPILGEATHQVVAGVPQLARAAQRTLGTMRANQAASQIEQQHGGDLAEFARQIADPNSPQGKANRALMQAGESPEALAQHGKTLERSVSGIAKSADEIQAAETIAKKTKLAGLMMAEDGVDPIPAIHSTDQIIEEMGQQIGDWKKNMVPGMPDWNALTKAERTLASYNLQAAPASLSGESDPIQFAANRFGLADQVKRELQDVIKNAHRSSPALEGLNRSETQLRDHLQNSELWGPSTGAMQQARNKAWTERLRLETHDTAPKTFLTDYQGIPSARPIGYKSVQLGDEPALRGIAKQAGTGSPEEWKLRQWADKSAGLGQALTDHPIDPNPELTALAESMGTQAQSINQTMDKAALEQAAQRKLQQIRATGSPQGVADMAAQTPQMGATTAALAQAGKGAGFFSATPQSLAIRATRIAGLEAQPPTNQVAQKALLGLQAAPGPRPLGVAGQTAVQGARFEGATQFTGSQLSDALQEWQTKAPKADEAKQISSESRGHDLGNTIEYAIQKNPSQLGPYADQFRGKSTDQINQILYQLKADPTWTSRYLPQFQSLTQAQ